MKKAETGVFTWAGGLWFQFNSMLLGLWVCIIASTCSIFPWLQRGCLAQSITSSHSCVRRQKTEDDVGEGREPPPLTTVFQWGRKKIFTVATWETCHFSLVGGRILVISREDRCSVLGGRQVRRDVVEHPGSPGGVGRTSSCGC